MAINSEQLQNGLLGKLYDKLTMGDEAGMRSSNDFFSWVTPGIPYTEENFDFQERGFVPTHLGIEGTEDTDDLDTDTDDLPSVDTDALNRELGAQKLQMYTQAEDLANLMDFIPSASGITEGNKRMNMNMQIWNPSGRVSDVYKFVLDQCQVVQTKMDDATKEKLERIRKILKTTKTVTDFDPETFEEIKREITVESRLSEAYKEKKQLYDTAFREYNNARIAALNGDDPQAVDYFAMNERILRSHVRVAKNDWYNLGYKDLYEKATAFIEQVTKTDLNLLMQDYRSDLDFSQISNPASPGSRFYFTKLAPSNFASSNRGWTQFSFSKSDYERHYDSSRSSWGAGGALALGFFNIGGGAQESKSEINRDINWETFSLSFSMAQVPIIRSWFHPGLLESKFWKFGQNADTMGLSELLSDGKTPPNGQMVAYPTTAIFIRDLELKFKTYSGNYNAFSESIRVKGGLSWGPINLGGHYSRSNSEYDFKSSTTREGIKVDGMQLIGFRSHLLPKSPNPINTPDTEWA